MAPAAFCATAACNLGAAGAAVVLTETLPEDARKPVTLQNSQPLAWASVFNLSPRMRRIALAALLYFAASANAGKNLELRQRFG